MHKEVAPYGRCLCSAHNLRWDYMTKASLSAIRWIDLDASLGSPCSWCRHSEFVHTESGPCLFSECKCPRFGLGEADPHDEPADEPAA